MKKNYYEDEAVISAFVTNARVQDIMGQAHISRNTYYKLRRDKKFMGIVSERRDQIVKDALLRMQGYLTSDVNELHRIIHDDLTPPATKVSAIRVMIDGYKDLATVTDILDRLEALEEG